MKSTKHRGLSLFCEYNKIYFNFCGAERIMSVDLEGFDGVERRQFRVNQVITRYKRKRWRVEALVYGWDGNPPTEVSKNTKEVVYEGDRYSVEVFYNVGVEGIVRDLFTLELLERFIGYDGWVDDEAIF